MLIDLAPGYPGGLQMIGKEYSNIVAKKLYE